MMLDHKIVYVEVVAVLDAGAGAVGPRGPEAVADPTLPEGRNARGRPIQGIAREVGVGEIVVLDLYPMLAGRHAMATGYSYPRSRPRFLSSAQSARSREKAKRPSVHLNRSFSSS
jgi:hypothetical protein